MQHFGMQHFGIGARIVESLCGHDVAFAIVHVSGSMCGFLFSLCSGSEISCRTFDHCKTSNDSCNFDGGLRLVRAIGHSPLDHCTLGCSPLDRCQHGQPTS